MTQEEADAVIRRIRQGSRLLLGEPVDSNGDRDLLEIRTVPGGEFEREDSRIPGDANTPSPPSARRALQESELRSMLLTWEIAHVREGLTRIPKPADYAIEVVEGGAVTRRYHRICGLQARTVEDLKAGARREGGDALLDVQAHLVADPAVAESLRGVYVQATIIEWLE